MLVYDHSFARRKEHKLHIVEKLSSPFSDVGSIPTASTKFKRQNMEEKFINYDNYLKNHKENVLKAFNLLYDKVNACIFNFQGLSRQELEKQILAHDDSKRTKEEYEFYADYFFGERTESVKEKFKIASDVHKSRNPHHPEYWEKSGVISMPDRYLFEMLCDWWSFYLASGKPEDIFDWYKKEGKKFVFCKENQDKIDKAFNIIKEICNTKE